MTLVCPSCGARWKILPGSRGDRFAPCPCCPVLPASVAEAAPVAEPCRSRATGETHKETDDPSHD